MDAAAQAHAAISSPPGSRLFIVCGRSVEEATLLAAFTPYGTIQNIKLIKEKGVCYVKFDKASSAALAMEALNGAVLNNGRGPKLKVLLAEAPTPRGVQGPPKTPPPPEEAPSCDPDNVPPRSRLFLVVPKTAEARLVHEELSRYPDLEYCKTDLIASKGCVFVKYAKASSALLALEEVAAKGMLGCYKVKVMLAEPKTKRARPEANLGLFGPVGPLQHHLAGLGLDAAGAMRLPPAAAGQFGAFGLGAAANTMLAAQQAAVLSGAAAAAGAAGDYSHLHGYLGLHGASGLAAAAAAAAAAASPSAPGMDQLAGQVGLGGFGGLGAPGSAALMQQLAAHDAAAAMGAMPLQHSGMVAAAAAHHQLGQQQAAAHAAAAAAAAAAAQAAASGGFHAHSSPGAASSMGSVSSSLSGVNFPLGGFMGLASPHAGGGGGASLMSSAGMQQLPLAPQGHAGSGDLGQQLGGPPLSQQRLFVVVHKSVSEEQLRLLFRQYPGCEYCDLKKEKGTGRSKGYCYVNYSTPGAASQAVADLNGIEFPLGSGFRLKVMYAEIMTAACGGTGSASSSSSSGSAAAAAMLRSSSSRSSLRTPSAGQLGSLVRAGSGGLPPQPGGLCGGGGLMPQGSVPPGPGGGGSSVLSPVGSLAAGSGPHSSGSSAAAAAAAAVAAVAAAQAAAAGGPLGSAGPSPAATPIGPSAGAAHQQAAAQCELARVADGLSSLSLPSLGGPSPQHALSSMGSEHSDVAVAAAAAAATAHYGELKATAAVVGGSTVARELMFNMS